MKHLFVAATVTAGVWLAPPAWADPFFFSTGTPDGLLGALSQPVSTAQLETETADDFLLTETTSIAHATVTGLIPSGTSLANIGNVEIEVYHVFTKDSTGVLDAAASGLGFSSAQELQEAFEAFCGQQLSRMVQDRPRVGPASPGSMGNHAPWRVH